MHAAPAAAQPHAGIGHAHGAQNAGVLQGTVSDAKGGLIAKASVTVRDANGHSKTVTTDAEGHFVINGLAPGAYTIVAVAPGFSAVIKNGVGVSDSGAQVAFTLPIGAATTDVTVDADQTHSVAAALAPMDALLSETSARTEITSTMIKNFMSPVADFGEAVEMAPGTFTTNGNGVGLGQSSTYFRGFPDGDYDIDFDGIPFYDTNTPTHHSWAFFPAQFLGGIDFDRSPGTASTIGPTPFGGSIHLLSKELSPLQNVRATFSGGSFNTYLYDAEYDSGAFGPGGKFNTSIDVHHLQSHGYQSLNNQTRNAGAIKLQYQLSPSTTLTGFSGVIWLDANTPNFNATRCQMYGVGAGYSCLSTVSGATNVLLPYTGAGINFLLTNNSDPLLYLDDQYNFYHVPTDFEYVQVHSDLGKGFTFDIKPYTYNYDNSEYYAKATTITDATTINGSKTYMGLKIAPCDVDAVSTVQGISVGIYPCAVDKYNSYRKYGETSQLSQVSKYGILRAGMWYEWANTNRRQYPSDPTNNRVDSPLPNFSETYVTDSYQPFAEYEFHLGSKFTVTPGIKFAYYTIGTKQFADNGGKIGPLNGNPSTFITNGGSYFATLPSGSVNYRIKNNWSVYFQGATGSVVPPSAVFDFNQGTDGVPVATLPQQQKNLTYQGGTVVKLKRVTFDADVFRIHFDNTYSSFTPISTGEPVYFLTPSTNTTGFEAESNIYLISGLSLYLNGSYDNAVYSGTLNQSCTSGTAGCASTTAQYTFTAPSGQHVAQAPSDIETEGLTYQHKSWDIGIFNKRVGMEYEDNGQYHNQYTVAPFTLTNANINYTIREGRYANTKLAVSFNNLFNSSNITSVALAGKPVTENVAVNGITYTDPFNTNGQTPINGQDAVSILPARSIMLSVVFGFSPKSH
ncbi:TonB-dependent receptor plug domain-containing protein [Granulicella sp. 5B5]|nr:TonB-dependent receptor plug domain-containing protein [Granulicella sp. 5B5]